MSINELGEKLYRRAQRFYAAGYEGRDYPIDLRTISRSDRRPLRFAHAEGLEERRRVLRLYGACAL
jgi:hypothetical protein